MQFLFPTFLWALAALAIPVILHLFYFRRFKKVYFTNVRFLREVKDETSMRSKLRNLLVLAARLLAILFLVLAFAQPFIPQKGEVKKGIKAVSVYIDNSFSMSAASQDVPLLEKAKQRAREIVSAHGPEDRFQILSNEFSGHQQHLVSKEDALAMIEEITLGPEVQSLSKVIGRQKQALSLSKTDNQASYLISDFQRSVMDLSTYQDTLLPLTLIPLQSVQEKNLSIDTVWFEAPVRMAKQTTPLFIKIHNHSATPVENARVSLKYGNEIKPVGSFSIGANADRTDTVNITITGTGWQRAEVTLTDYPIQFDDQYFFSFFVADEIKVLAINDAAPNRFLQAAVNGLPYFKVTDANSQSIDYSKFIDYQLIVLNDLANLSSGMSAELKDYIDNGGNVLLFPGRNANLGTYSAFLQSFPANTPQSFEQVARIVGEVNQAEFIFKDVFLNRSANLRLPSTNGNFTFGRFNSRAEEQLLSYRDGSPYLSKYKQGKGNLYVCAAPLSQEFNNLVNSGEIFIPMLYKMAISAGTDPRIAYTIGRDELLEADHQANSAEIVYKMKGEGGEFIPEQRTVGAKVFLTMNGQVKKSGFYDLFLNPGQVNHGFAFNYNRRESALQYFSPEELSERLGEKVNIISALDTAVLTARIEENNQGTVLWRWCIILVLLFLGIEILLLRFWKV
jgi:hypothetical protein